MGLSFCAMWYKALIAFILNRGGFLSAKGRKGRAREGYKKKRSERSIERR